jgi:hypothetical protein
VNTSSLQLKLALIVSSSILTNSFLQTQALAHSRRLPPGGRIAIVVDERLSVLRATPDLSGKLLRRVARGKLVAVRRERRSSDGILFYQVNVTRRTQGWIQRDAVISMRQAGDDQRLLRLIKASDDFDRIARARIFLDAFPRSLLRPAVLLLYGAEAEEAAAKLSHDAARRLDQEEMKANGAPMFSYFLNYNGLDRYSRQGVRFVFDREKKKFHYDGASWREIVRRYPRSPEAEAARTRLEELSKVQ